MTHQQKIRCMAGFIILLAVLTGAMQPAHAAAPDPDMQGVWRGALEIPEQDTIAVNIQFYKTEDGEDRLFLIAPDDEVLVVEDLTLRKDSIEFASEEAGLSYKGTLKRGETIDGTLTLREQEIPLKFVLDKGNEDSEQSP